MTIRVCTLPGIPRFLPGNGLEFGESWVHLVALEAPERAALQQYVGRILRIHPDDVAKLGELGLVLDKEGRLVDAKSIKSEPVASVDNASTFKTPAKAKADARKE